MLFPYNTNNTDLGSAPSPSLRVEHVLAGICSEDEEPIVNGITTRREQIKPKH